MIALYILLSSSAVALAHIGCWPAVAVTAAMCLVVAFCHEIRSLWSRKRPALDTL